jgi:hypothetical protein
MYAFASLLSVIATMYQTDFWCPFQLLLFVSIADSSERFYVNVQFSPGAALDPFIFAEENHLLPVSRPVPVHGRIPLPQFKKMFSAILKPMLVVDIHTYTVVCCSSRMHPSYVCLLCL